MRHEDVRDQDNEDDVLRDAQDAHPARGDPDRPTLDVEKLLKRSERANRPTEQTPDEEREGDRDEEEEEVRGVALQEDVLHRGDRTQESPGALPPPERSRLSARIGMEGGKDVEEALPAGGDHRQAA